MAAAEGTVDQNVSVEAVDLESKIIELCQNNPLGITDATIKTALPDIDVPQRAIAINRLLSRGKIDILKQGNELKYRLKDREAASTFKGANAEEKLVYQIIKNAANKGIWSRDIRNKCNLNGRLVDKILKTLESKKFIKSVKTVTQSKRKVYMLYNLVPDPSITGGAWYQDQDFEVEFVKVLNEQCYRFLNERLALGLTKTQDPILQRSSASVSAEEIKEYIMGLGISKVSLTLKDIESILNTLIYDGKATKSVQIGSSSSIEDGVEFVYRSIKPLVEPSGLIKTPCGVCPLIRECSPDGTINPGSCPYLKEWAEGS